MVDRGATTQPSLTSSDDIHRLDLGLHSDGCTQPAVSNSCRYAMSHARVLASFSDCLLGALTSCAVRSVIHVASRPTGHMATWYGWDHAGW